MKDNRKAREVYEEFRLAFDECWYCGYHPSRWTHGRFQGNYLHIHHIIRGSGRRVADRRAIVMLCAECHARAHGDRIVVRGERLAPIGVEEVLKLKRDRDPDYWDWAWLKEIKRDLPPPHDAITDQGNA